ncbi:MAG: ATP-binding protein [Elusimicrobiales bacterium]|jgi:signal transduction histidine kinase/FixJ family two-component response regulator
MKQMLSKESKIFSGLALAWGVAFVFFWQDKSQGGAIFPPGVLTVLLECGLEAMAIWHIISSGDCRKPVMRWFFIMFCCILPADFSYLIVHYAMKMDNGAVTFITTTLPYSTAYLFGIVGFWTALRRWMAPITKRNFLSVVWLPILFSIPVLFTILIPLMFSYYRNDGWSFLLFELVFNSIFAMSFFFFAVIAFAFSIDKIVSFLALGGILLQLGNWGIYSALLNGDAYTLTEYEFLWLCGIIALCYGIVIVKKESLNGLVFGICTLDNNRPRRSLIAQQRQMAVGFVSTAILITVVLLHRGLWSYRIAFFGVGASCFISLFLGELLGKQIMHYSTLFGKVVKYTAVDVAQEIETNDIPLELWQIYQSAFQSELFNHRIGMAVRENMTELAAQVAHDIRSPLAALDSVMDKTAQLPEKQRIMVRHAINRIRDIANNLLEKNRQQPKPVAMPGSPAAENKELTETRLLSSAIDPVITEKRLQFESKPGINIDFELTREAYGLFAKIQPVEFRRIVSNLVNNSVEVLGDKGKVAIGLARDEANIILTVADNGKGIPPEIVPKLGHRGETHDKAGGSGLGLYHARTAVENWGGGLTIASEVGKGTTVTIKLPKAEAPQNFVPVLELVSGRPVAVLDDDDTIHQIWDGLFESSRVKEQGIEVAHFSVPDKLREWVKNNKAKAEKAVYLFDYELIGYKETGLSLAEELKLCGKAILVTSRYEEKRIIDECKRLKVRMIPKGLASLVPIRIQDSADESETASSARQADAVLVDDDALVRMNWKFAAQAKGVALVIFESPGEFVAQAGRFPKETPIYLDSELDDDEENGVKGENIAQDLRNKGYVDITLETGHMPEKFAHLPWLKVIDKTPPWNC